MTLNSRSIGFPRGFDIMALSYDLSMIAVAARNKISLSLINGCDEIFNTPISVEVALNESLV